MVKQCFLQGNCTGRTFLFIFSRTNTLYNSIRALRSRLSLYAWDRSGQKWRVNRRLIDRTQGLLGIVALRGLTSLRLLLRRVRVTWDEPAPES